MNILKQEILQETRRNPISLVQSVEAGAREPLFFTAG